MRGRRGLTLAYEAAELIHSSTDLEALARLNQRQDLDSHEGWYVRSALMREAEAVLRRAHHLESLIVTRRRRRA